MTKKVPTKKDIDFFIGYVSNRVDREKWFSLLGGHGYSVFDSLPFYGAVDIADFAAKLGFLETRFTPGSGAYMQYRITRDGIDLAEGMKKAA